jgi:hypothetical protein
MLEKYIEKINTIANELKNEYTCLTINNGFGYCGYGSELLRQRLIQEKIQCKVIIGRIFKNNEDISLFICSKQREHDSYLMDNRKVKQLSETLNNLNPIIEGARVPIAPSEIESITPEELLQAMCEILPAQVTNQLSPVTFVYIKVFRLLSH